MRSPGRGRASSKDAILRTFAEMVAEGGYAATSLADVAEAVQVSKGTIVHHYGTKDRMLAEVHARFMRRQLEELRNIEDVFPEPVERVAAIVYSLLAVHHDDQVAARVFMREFSLFAVSPQMRDVRLMRREYDQRAVAIIEAGVDAGLFRPEEVRLLALQIFGMCNYAWTWYRRDGEHTVEEIATSFLVVLFNGMLADEANPVDIAELVAKVKPVLSQDAKRGPLGAAT